jgi:hypothetical protein
MAYVLYNIETTKLVPTADRWVKTFRTEAAAKSARTRNKLSTFEYAIAEASKFYAEIEKKEVRQNLMSGKDFTVGVNSDYTTCPSSETYWCS